MTRAVSTAARPRYEIGEYVRGVWTIERLARTADEAEELARGRSIYDTVEDVFIRGGDES